MKTWKKNISRRLNSSITMLAELIQYNHLANLKVIESLLNAGRSMPEVERLFSHILNAQSIWVSRMQEKKVLVDTFQLQKPENFVPLQIEATSNLAGILAEDSLDRTVHYTNSKGEMFKNIVRDILYHVVNHSTYHRGQIAMLLRQNDVPPPVTEYIFYKREGTL